MSNNSIGLKGRVVVEKEFSNGRKKHVFTNDNLIVYTGREAILPILFKVSNDNIAPDHTWGLYYWGIGSGGLLDPSDPSTRVLPTPFDTELEEHLALFDPTVSGTTSDRKYRLIQNVSYLTDLVNGNKYLISVISLRIGKEEVNGASISEAGLFLSNSPIPSSATSFVLFSRVTFPSIVKQSSFNLLLTWYLYS